MRRSLALAALLAAVCFAAGCTSGTDDTCFTVSEQICGRLAECDSLDSVFDSESQCVTSFIGYFEVEGSDDAACVQTWSETSDLTCTAFLDYFQI